MLWIILAIIISIMLVIDWVIVMGTKPKKWKGGDNNGK